MSFSSQVKEELGRQYSPSRHCQIAELAAMFLMEGCVTEKPLTVEFHTDNTILCERYACLMKNAFGIEEAGTISEADALRVLGAFKLYDGVQPDLLRRAMDVRRCSGLLVRKTCCRRAFIRGAFLAAGSISDPSKSYHFEIVCRTTAQAEQLQEMMQGFGTDAKIVERKNHYVVYLKEGAQIVDILGGMGAYVSLMNLENVRILKEMRNSVNRKVNCETANITKTVSAAVRQIEDIILIRDRMGFDQLPDHLREIALLRLEYPEAALKELGGLLNPPVGKSGVNHRLRKLAEIAERLR